MVEGKIFKMGKNFRPTCGFFCCVFVSWGLPCSSDSKQSACNAEDPGSIPGLGRSSKEGNGNPLQDSCLENPYSDLSLMREAAAKSLQSCPTLCDPIDGNPPGSPVPGILQARTLEWIAVSFSNT